MEPSEESTLTWHELRFLQLIHEPFLLGDWPVFQHVNVVAWQELTNAGAPEPRDIYAALSARGLVAPPVPSGQSWQLRDETKVRLTLFGLTHVDRATNDIGRFMLAINHIAERAAKFRPSSPTSADRLRVDQEEIRLIPGLAADNRDLLRLAYLLRDEAPVWTSFSGPDPGTGWSLEVDVEVARRFRGAVTVSEFLAVDRERRGPPPEIRFQPVLPTLVDGAFVRAVDGGGLYVFTDNLLHPIDEITFFAMGGVERQIVDVHPALIERFGVGERIERRFADGTLVKGSEDPIFQIDDGRKRWVPDMQTLSALSHGENVYVRISDAVLDAIPDGPPIPGVGSRVDLTKRRSPFLGRLSFIPRTVGFLADTAVAISAGAAIVTKLLHLW